MRAAISLNAPSGAGCFLTRDADAEARRTESLNAPCGVGCALTWPRYFQVVGESES